MREQGLESVLNTTHPINAGIWESEVLGLCSTLLPLLIPGYERARSGVCVKHYSLYWRQDMKERGLEYVLNTTHLTDAGIWESEVCSLCKHYSPYWCQDMRERGLESVLNTMHPTDAGIWESEVWSLC